jgi:acyl-CoA thioesterase-2
MPESIPDPDPTAMMARLIALLDVEALEVDLFRGQSSGAGWTRVYGGQVVAQALMAASRTVRAERLAHSLHAYFLRPGDPAAPIVYRVARDRDGQSFSTRRIVAIQHGRPIFNMSASFQVVEVGLEHSVKLPKVVAPDTLPSEFATLLRTANRIPEPHRTLWLERDRPFEFRPVERTDPLKPRKAAPLSHNWFRAAAPVPADPVLARCLLAYASDMTLLDTSLLPHGVPWTDPNLQVASLDHALWFHGDPPLDDWLLYAQDSPVSGGGRGMNRGLIFARDGRLVATAMQEGLIRHRAPA